MKTNDISKNGAQRACNKQTIKLQLIRTVAVTVGPILLPQHTTNFSVTLIYTAANVEGKAGKQRINTINDTIQTLWQE